MKCFSRIQRLASVFVAGTVLAVSSPAQTFFTNGLVAHYPFNGNANDASGNGNNLTVVNADLTTNRFGQLSGAYSFNGSQTTSGSTIFGTNLLLNLGQAGYTVQFWFKPDNNTQVTRCLFSSANADETADTGLYIGYNNNTAPGRVTTYIGAGNSDNNWTLLSQFGAKNNYQAGQWYSLTFTKTNTTYNLYINGTLDKTVNNPSAATYNKASLIRLSGYKAGAGGGIGDQVFAGGLDDVRIYNRALTTNEIAQLYAIESAPLVGLAYAVKPTFSNLAVGTNYQLQVSTSLNGTFTNYGSAFTATNNSMIYPQYFDVANWSQLFFRVTTAP